MIFRFENSRLDTETGELWTRDALVPVEPQVLALLQLLLENADRLVSRHEIVERIWHGRIVSESAIDSRIKSARRAIGDDGRAQRMIRTVPKRGFRFVAPLEIASTPSASVVAKSHTAQDPPGDPPAEERSRPSTASGARSTYATASRGRSRSTALR